MRRPLGSPGLSSAQTGLYLRTLGSLGLPQPCLVRPSESVWGGTAWGLGPTLLRLAGVGGSLVGGQGTVLASRGPWGPLLGVECWYRPGLASGEGLGWGQEVRHWFYRRGRCGVSCGQHRAQGAEGGLPQALPARGGVTSGQVTRGNP